MRIIYGLSGSGKSEYCFNRAEELWKNTEKRVFFVVPEQYSYRTERTLVDRLGIISPKTVEVLSFKRLFFYVCNEMGGSLLPRLSETGRAILLAKASKKCSKELKVLGKSAKYKGFSGVLTGLFSELKRYNNTPLSLKESISKLDDGDVLKLKMQDTLLLFETFEEEIKDRFSDSDDDLTVLCGIIKEHKDYFSDSVFFIDGFEGFTPQELSVITELAKQAEVNVTLCTDTLDDSGDRANVFTMQTKTAKSLFDICRDNSVTMEQPYFAQYEGTDVPEEKKIIESNFAHGKYDVYEKEPAFIKLFTALSCNAETDYVANEVISLVRDSGIRYRDICIVSGSLDIYKSIITETFEKYDIPVYISDKKPLCEEIPAASLLHLFEIVRKNWDYDSVFAFLKSGFASVTDTQCDKLDNYVLRTGIRGSTWKTAAKWHYIPKGYTETDVDEIDEIRKKATERIITFEKDIKNSNTVREYITALFEFMTALDYFGKINTCAENLRGEYPDACARLEQDYNAIITCLDEIYAVCGEEETSVDEFEAMLVSAFETHTVGIIPTSADSVTVTDTARCRANKCRVLFLIGANEGSFPEIFTVEGILKDEERAALEKCGISLAPDTISRMYNEEFTVYSTLISPSEKLYVSYTLTDNVGSSRQPSPVIERICESFPNLKELNLVTGGVNVIERVSGKQSAAYLLADSKSVREYDGKSLEAFAAIEKWFKKSGEYKEQIDMIHASENFENIPKSISRENIDRFFGETFKTSVSALECFSNCPFKYYANYMLDAKPRADTQLQRVDTGTIMHSVIEKISNLVKEEKGSWHNAEFEWIRAKVEEITEEEIEKIKNIIDGLKPSQLWMLIRIKDAMKMSAETVALQLKSGEFEPLGYEITFDDKGEYKPIEFKAGGKTVKLRGKIDRSDIYTDESGQKFIRIIDYKSGNKNFDIKNLYYGLNIQLAVYLSELSDCENANAAGMLYFRLQDPIVEGSFSADDEEISKLTSASFKTNGLIVDDDKIIEKMDGGYPDSDTYLPIGAKSRSVATPEQFDLINRYLKKLLAKLSKEIIDGKNLILPIKEGDDLHCNFCDYRPLCHFDGEFKNRYRKNKTLKKEDVWNLMKEEAEKDD